VWIHGNAQVRQGGQGRGGGACRKQQCGQQRKPSVLHACISLWGEVFTLLVTTSLNKRDVQINRIGCFFGGATVPYSFSTQHSNPTISVKKPKIFLIK
jgi:hypothetical protein